jgi:hypothetical protein
MRSLMMSLILCLCLLAAGCSPLSPQPGPDTYRLPPLPAGSGRSPSAQQQVSLTGQQYHSMQGASQDDPGVLLTAPASGLSWAIYELPGVGPQYIPQQVATTVRDVQGEYWLAIADYSRGVWELAPAPFTDSALLPLDNWEDHCSGGLSGGSLFCAVLASGGRVTVDAVVFTLDNTLPLPAPTGLTGAPGPQQAELSWDAYGDPRASELRMYQSADSGMAGAILADTLPAAATATTITSLTAGATYYFALTAYDSSDALESLYSTIVPVVPTNGADTTITLAGGGWPRFGGRADGGGCTDQLGPPNLNLINWISLSDPPGTVNRCSPIVGPDGKVYALGRDARLVRYPANISFPDWTFHAADHGDSGISYVCPPQAPLLDDEGNCYFSAVPDKAETTRTGYVFCVAADGSFKWKFNLGDMVDDNDLPYPSLNVSWASGVLLAAGSNNRILYAIDGTGAEAWKHDFNPSIEFYADCAIDSGGDALLPVWFSGIGMDQLTRWVRLDGSSGAQSADYTDFGAAQNFYGGVAWSGARFIYGEKDALVMLDSTGGSFLASAPLAGNVHAPAARTSAASHVFLLVPPNGGPPACAGLGAFQPSADPDPPALAEVWSGVLGSGDVYCKPAVDGGNNLFFGDSSGQFYRVHFDAVTPLNSSITHHKMLGGSSSYHFNSPALGNGCAYVVSEQGNLYCVGNP